MNLGMFSSSSEKWGTPQEVFDELDREFHFDLDPCPGEATLSANLRHLEDGLTENWFPYTAAFVNPPYGREITKWVERAAMFARIGLPRDDRRTVLLLPARTDTGWWHDLILPQAFDIRFIRGRLGFTGVTPKLEKGHTTLRSRAPFPSVVVVL